MGSLYAPVENQISALRARRLYREDFAKFEKEIGIRSELRKNPNVF